MYSMYFVCSYFICPVYCSIDTNACQYVRIKKLLLLLLIAITNSKFKKINGFRHALSHKVHACQISAKSGQEICQNRNHKK